MKKNRFIEMEKEYRANPPWASFEIHKGERIDKIKDEIDEWLKWRNKERKKMTITSGYAYCKKCHKETLYEYVDEFEGLMKWMCTECGNIKIGIKDKM